MQLQGHQRWQWLHEEMDAVEAPWLMSAALLEQDVSLVTAANLVPWTSWESEVAQEPETFHPCITGRVDCKRSRSFRPQKHVWRVNQKADPNFQLCQAVTVSTQKMKKTLEPAERRKTGKRLIYKVEKWWMCTLKKNPNPAGDKQITSWYKNLIQETSHFIPFWKA